MGREIADGMYATIAGKGVVVSRKQIDIEGWSIVLMEPKDRINIYRLAGFLIAGFIFVLVAIPLIINYKTNRLMEIVRQSEESKSLLLHASGEGMFGVDTTGQLTFINSTALLMLGFTEGEMVGQQAHGLIHHSNKDGSNYPAEDCSLCASYTNATEIYSKEEIFWRKDGSSFSVEYSSMPIIRDGQAIGAVVTFNDITNRKQAEQTLRDSEEKFRKITTSAWDAIIMMNNDGIITYWNEAAEKIFGYTHDETVGKELHTLIAPQKYYQSSTKGLDHFKKTGQGNLIGKTLELSGLRKDGTEFPIELSLSSVYIQGKWSAIGIIRDITDRKEADVLFRESAERFRVAIEQANDGVTITEGDRQVYVNQKFLDIFGYERREDIVGNTCYHDSPPR
jgi:PAS domain S-box-containing protein